MTRAKIVREELYERDLLFQAIYIETKNAALVLLSEAEDQLGTLAASVPTSLGMQTPLPPSSVLLGDRQTITARMFAERLATKTGKIGLVSVHLKTIGENEANPILLKLFKKVTTVPEKQEVGRENIET